MADLLLDLLADLPLRYWHLMVKMSSNLADLLLDMLADLSPGTDILWSRWVQIWQINPYQYWHLAGEDEFQFDRSTPRSAGRTTPLVWTSHGENGFTFGRSTLLVLTSHSQDGFKYGWSTPYICWQIYPPGTGHLTVNMSSNMADLLLDLLADQSPQVLTSYDQYEFKFGRSIPRYAWHINPPLVHDILWSRWVQIWQIYP